MTTDDDDLNAFYDSVVKLTFRTDAGPMHGPETRCFEGNCLWSPTTCGWKGLFQLAEAFWKTGPDVNADWKYKARQQGFDADELHESMLAVFVGGSDPFTIAWNHATAIFKEMAKKAHVDGNLVKP